MPGLKLELFGPPSVTLDGVPVETRRRKGMALLAYLAVEEQPPISRRRYRLRFFCVRSMKNTARPKRVPT